MQTFTQIKKYIVCSKKKQHIFNVVYVNDEISYTSEKVKVKISFVWYMKINII